MNQLNNLKKFLNDNEAKGEIIKNFGLAFLVNAGYGISDRSFETYNIIDIIL